MPIRTQTVFKLPQCVLSRQPENIKHRASASNGKPPSCVPPSIRSHPAQLKGSLKTIPPCPPFQAAHL
ncbi:hypothetical protein GCWU000324_01362 [Kingella oralis ATCC 51147]|uniref:Uncharacterized protein n=1 Tax=Kingella oralis ATCC 51147 TaxID=629741 RepID=C4GGU3_9NEIS|nr:hypothetical protein GCWU000324_01362 [Kingella oralis ATCC 51147]